MHSVRAYHRPTSLDDAQKLLSESGNRALAGGTVVVAEARQISDDGVEVVDLQALGLDGIEPAAGSAAGSGGERLRVGAMVRLSDLVVDERISVLLHEAARRELPSALRNQATVGGTVAQADAESVLIAALLVHDADVEVHGQESQRLGAYLAGDRSGLIVAINIETGGRTSLAATGRTPADTPIVAALARATEVGTRLALTGMAAQPIEVDAADPTDGLAPPSDFRGSSDYRLHLATVLSSRVLEEVK